LLLQLLLQLKRSLLFDAGEGSVVVTFASSVLGVAVDTTFAASADCAVAACVTTHCPNPKP
jgi:hypothetical protein